MPAAHRILEPHLEEILRLKLLDDVDVREADANIAQVVDVVLVSEDEHRKRVLVENDLTAVQVPEELREDAL